MIINEPIHVQMDDDETETFANALRTHLNKQVNHFPMNSFCLIFIFRFNSYQ
jgi:hypothetical protein